MSLSPQENYLRCVRFEKPDYIPMRFGVSDACWHHYDQEALKDLMEGHPRLFPDYRRPAGVVKPDYLLNARAGQSYTDPWGCVWETTDDGITGTVLRHPLENWDDFDRYRAPDPEVTNGTYPVDWKKIEDDARRARANGNLVSAALPHGHTFLRLQDIRGYENLMCDMAEDHPKLSKLIDMVGEFNFQYVARGMALSPDFFCYPEDLGMNVGPMLSPEHFRKHIKPVYRRLMQPAREKGCIIHMHCDGDIRLLADDLLDVGVQIINLQDLVNGIDWIKQKFAGKICIDLGVDSYTVVFGSPGRIEALIREEVEKLGSPQGGLKIVGGMMPSVPLKNAKALMDAMEKYMGYYS